LGSELLQEFGEGAAVESFHGDIQLVLAFVELAVGSKKYLLVADDVGMVEGVEHFGLSFDLLDL
jgi:hypothetical protein